MRVLHLHPGPDTGGQSVAGKRALELAGDEVRVFATSFAFFDYPRANEWDHYAPDDIVRESWEWADVVVLHNQPALLHAAVAGSPKPLVVHHHGSHFRKNPTVVWAEGARLGALQLVSTVDLLLSVPTGQTGYWLPQVVDVEQMAAIRRDNFRPHTTIRISHAPTARRIKGTREFTRAARQLKALVEWHLISHEPWARCLARKAATDIFGDQLFLGYGNNAIEAWAMGLPVLAGATPNILNRMEAEYPLPFFTTSGDQLTADLRAFAMSADLRAEWAERGMAHVQRFHAQPAYVKRVHELYALAGA